MTRDPMRLPVVLFFAIQNMVHRYCVTHFLRQIDVDSTIYLTAHDNCAHPQLQTNQT